MPSRQAGSLAVAAAFALLAVFIFCAQEKHRAWCTKSLSMPRFADDGTSGPMAHSGVARTSGVWSGDAKQGRGKRKGEGGAAPSSSSPLSKEVVDVATGLALPRTKRFSRSDLTCLGAGVRAKSIAVAKINVYTVGLYVDPKGARGALRKYTGLDPARLRKDASVFKVLGAAGFSKYLHLVFARSVGAKKVVEALTSVKGVNKDVLDRFSAIMLDAVGGSIGKGETVSLGWEGKDKMVVLVRDRPAGTVIDAALPRAVFDLYLGDTPVSLAAKSAFAEGLAAFLSS